MKNNRLLKTALSILGYEVIFGVAGLLLTSSLSAASAALRMPLVGLIIAAAWALVALGGAAQGETDYTMTETLDKLAKKNGYSVVREVGGHGVGIEFHEDPFVSYVTRRGTGMIMAPGMIFTIEPMVNMGTNRIYIDADNDWTIYTQDGKPSAQWEIQVLVTETGHEVLAW